MNPPTSAPEPARPAPTPTDPAPQDLPPPAPVHTRRNGKIAHLPKEKRDLINGLFDQGSTYENVRRECAAQGISLNLENISQWYHGGYQDELQQRERRQQLRAAQDVILELARRDDDATALPVAGLQIALTQLAQQLFELVPGAHKLSLQNDADHYLRMLNTLARMSKALLALQKYYDNDPRTLAAQLPKRDLNDDVSDPQYDLLVNKMDQVFRMPRRRRPPSDSSAVPSAVASAKAEASVKSAPPLTGSATQPAPSQTGTPPAPANGHLDPSEKSP
jgi:hypothetical protein